MSKKFRESLEALSADQVTEMLGDLCEKTDALMADRTKGSITTLFSAVALSITERRETLADMAAKKNKVTYKGSDFEAQLAAIADAVEARDSLSAVKIREHVLLVESVERAVGGKHSDISIFQAASYAIATLKEFKRLG
jgi:hypothetical protein